MPAKYKSPALKFALFEKVFFVRALVLTIILPGLGQIADFPAWLAEQADIQARLTATGKKKPSAVEEAQLRAKLVFPDILQSCLETTGRSSAFEIQESETAFTPDAEEITAVHAALLKEKEDLLTENAALLKEREELLAQIEALTAAAAATPATT